MPVMTYRGEKTLDDVAYSLFGKLTTKQRETVTEALLKANPRLAKPGELAHGTILRMPDKLEVHPKTSRALENPDALLAKTLADAVAAFGQRFEARAKQATADSEEQIALITSAGLKDALNKAPELQALAEQIAKSQTARSTELQERQKSVSTALAAIKKALG